MHQSGFTKFYCPASPQDLSAVLQGQNGVSTTVSFTVDDAETLGGNDPSLVAFATLRGDLSDQHYSIGACRFTMDVRFTRPLRTPRPPSARDLTSPSDRYPMRKRQDKLPFNDYHADFHGNPPGGKQGGAAARLSVQPMRSPRRLPLLVAERAGGRGLRETAGPSMGREFRLPPA